MSQGYKKMFKINLYSSISFFFFFKLMLMAP